MTRHPSSNGPTMSGSHRRRQGLRSQTAEDRQFVELSLQSTIEFGTPGQQQEAQQALRWLKRHGAAAYAPKRRR